MLVLMFFLGEGKDQSHVSAIQATIYILNSCHLRKRGWGILKSKAEPVTMQTLLRPPSKEMNEIRQFMLANVLRQWTLERLERIYSITEFQWWRASPSLSGSTRHVTANYRHRNGPSPAYFIPNPRNTWNRRNYISQNVARTRTRCMVGRLVPLSETSREVSCSGPTASPHTRVFQKWARSC